jgi:LAS superfamily LD-carboxypeptidase LdcB
MLDPLQLTGRSRSHIVDLLDPACSLHPAAAAALLAMRAAAAQDGIDLAPVSSFRDFARQLAIWNGKFCGERPLFDRSGCELDHSSIACEQLPDTILLWSALPGASRHHWGSDLDVVDNAAIARRQLTDPKWQPELLPQEFSRGAVFEALESWLTAHAGEYGFFRPYARDLGGVQPEPWHLSYAPVAEPALAAFSSELLRAALVDSDLLGKEQVLERLPELVERYVWRISPADARTRRA